MSSRVNDANLYEFDHEYTPQALSEINARLSVCLSQTPIDEKSLQKIIEQRANLVESLLNNLDIQHKHVFAKLELNMNDTILAHVEKQKNYAKNALGKVSKASKAIKKYHQV